MREYSIRCIELTCYLCLFVAFFALDARRRTFASVTRLNVQVNLPNMVAQNTEILKL